MIIRPLRDSDVDACAALMLAMPLWTRYQTTREAARGLFAGAAAGGSQALVAEDGGRVIGFVVYSLRGTFDRSGYVRAIGIAAEAQRLGAGARLMDAAEREIFGAGPNVFLLVAVFNAGAQRFYEKRGYRRIGEITDYVREGITEILYRKSRGPIQARETARES